MQNIMDNLLLDGFMKGIAVLLPIFTTAFSNKYPFISLITDLSEVLVELLSVFILAVALIKI